MKKVNHLIVFLSVCFLTISLSPAAAADWQGSWGQEVVENGKKVTHVLLFSGSFFSWTAYESDSGAFILTKGGSWKTKGKKLTLLYEFHTADKEMVGKNETIGFAMKKDGLQLKNGMGKWSILDEGVESPLAGAWLISGRKVDGEIRSRNTDRPRKTMKILTPTRFQWIAYNTETGDFFGTGGGSYTAEDGKYTEHIEFFSRNNDRVGASLEFNFEVKNGDWIHSGKSSSGKPLYEIWSIRKADL